MRKQRAFIRLMALLLLLPVLLTAACSFAASGVRDVGRLGATSLYGRCTPIAPQEARPGDLIFFEGTISGEEGITHVGLYVGGNHMLHCGSPIGYADLTDSYWQNHFYGYGRLYE